MLLALWALAVLGCLLGLAVPPPPDLHPDVAQQALDLVRVVSTAALAIVLTLGPGTVWRAGQGRRRLPLGFVPLPGLALLVGTGCLAWALAGAVSPRVVCFSVLIPVLAWLFVGVLRAGEDELLEAEERRVLLIVAGVLGVAAARALWSLDPPDEVLAGTVFRTLEVGDRPDSIIPFDVVRLVVHGLSPFGGLSRGLQISSFSVRGPLSGIASAPVVVLAGGRPSIGPRAQPWMPFDPQGFMAYRLAMMTFACTAFLSLWTLTRRLAGERAARLAVLLAATTPFLVHEVWFTWPKLLAASLVFLAALSLIDGRPLLAGLVVGVAYLVHPLALLSLPALVLLALWPLVGAHLPRPRVKPALLVLGGVAVGLIAWRLVNGSHYNTSDFVQYLTRAGRQKFLANLLLKLHLAGHGTPLGNLALKDVGGHPGVTLSDWLSDRFVSVSNTLVPLRLLIFSGHDPSINAISGSCYPLCAGSSPFVVHFFFQYWNTLPFGVAIVFFPLLLLSLWRADRLWRWPVFVAVVVPFVVFAVYWGDASTGLLREGLHTWVLTLFAVVAAEQKHQSFAWLRSSPTRALLALRSVEVLLVAVMPTLVTRHRLYDQRFVLTDSLALLAMLVLCSCLGIWIWREQPPPLKRLTPDRSG